MCYVIVTHLEERGLGVVQRDERFELVALALGGPSRDDVVYKDWPSSPRPQVTDKRASRSSHSRSAVLVEMAGCIRIGRLPHEHTSDRQTGRRARRTRARRPSVAIRPWLSYCGGASDCPPPKNTHNCAFGPRTKSLGPKYTRNRCGGPNRSVRRAEGAMEGEGGSIQPTSAVAVNATRS